MTDKTLGPGQFSVTYPTLNASDAVIRVTAQVGNSERQIEQTVERSGFNNGTFSGGDTDLNESQSGGGTVVGDVVCGASCSVDAGYNVTGTTSTTSATPPPVDLNSLIALTTSTHSGNLTINGNYTDNVHVTGDVTITDTGTVTGVIVADGDVSVDADHTGTRDVSGTLAAGGNMIIDYKQTSSGTMTAQSVGGVIRPLLVAAGNLRMTFHQQTTVTFQGAIHAGGDIEFDLRQDDIIVIEGSIMAGGDIDIDSKQQTNITIDSVAGSNYVPPYTVKLTSWKEI